MQYRHTQIAKTGKDLSGGRGRLSHSKPIKEEFYLLENLAEKS